MINWYEALPGFWLPNGWEWTEEEYPDYTADAYVRALSDAPDISDIIKLGPPSQASRRAWGAWLSNFGADKKLSRGWPELEDCARVKYEAARYKFLVPAWSRAITDVLTEIDDIEDQLSTILWALETVSKKFIPIPKGWIDATRRTADTLDCAGKLLGGLTLMRSGKSEYTECLAQIGRERRAKREQKAGLLAWFQENWGRLIEAAQASNTWSDVGIVLGPIMGFINEGMWGVIKATERNYTIGIDALFPGYAEWVREVDRELDEAIQKAFNETWGAIPPERWEEIDPWYEPF